MNLLCSYRNRRTIVYGALAVTALAAGIASMAGAFGQDRDLFQGGSITWSLGDGPQHRYFDITGKQSNKDLNYRHDVVLVGFHEWVSADQREAIIAIAGLIDDPTCVSPYFNRLLLSRDLSVSDAIRALQSDPRVRFAEPDYIVHSMQHIPNDPLFPQLYGLHNTGQTGGNPDADIDAPEAWVTQKGSQSVVVAVIDTGVDYNHPDLTANIMRNAGVVVGYDYINNDGDPMDDNSHGTHCAGTIGGKGNNLLGVAGVCHDVRLMPVKFLSAGGSGSISNAVLCVDFATTNGANVMSNSWGGGGFSQAMLDAILRARDANILFVAAAGNASTNMDSATFYPASYNSVASNVVAVAATTHTDSLASFSNYGSVTVEIAAPGNDTLSTVPVGLDNDGNPDGYSLKSGTSMACPHVAGAAALVKSQYPGATFDALKARMMTSADHPAALAGRVISGRLNVYNALDNDSTPPGDPSGLIGCQRSTSAITLQWISSGDDGEVGSASSYDLRYSNSPIHAGNFGQAKPVIGTPIPQPAGSAETYTVTGLFPGDSYYFALRSKDNVGNPSGIIVAGPYTTKAAVWMDRVEGAPQFTVQSGPWAVTNAASSSPVNSWTDSPGGNYVNNLNINLDSTEAFSVTGPMTFSFACKNALETGYDYLHVEASTDNGANWTRLYTIGGTSDWKRHSVSLASYVGQNVKLRFKLTTDVSIVFDGVYLDDFVLSGATVLHLDNLEGANNYSGDSPWDLTTLQSFSPTHSYTDSPAGNYVDNLDIALTRNSGVPLSNILSASLAATCKIDLERNYDYLRFQVSTDNGGSYTELGAVTGSADWTRYAFTMPSGTDARIRFRMTSDYSIVRDGVYIDDISIIGEPAEPINTIMGQVTLGDYVGNVSSVSATFVLKNVGSATPLDTVHATLDANGNYSFTTNLPAGNYDVYAVASHWLPMRTDNLTVNGCVGNVNFSLINGNASNDDAEVNLVDYSAVAAAFGSADGDPNWNPLADLDGDGEVTLVDVGIVSANFGIAGDE